MKRTQRQKVEEILRRDGQISNFYCLDNRITIRLGAIIHLLRDDGWDIVTEMEGANCIYKLRNVPAKMVLRPVFQENGTVRMVESKESIW